MVGVGCPTCRGAGVGVLVSGVVRVSPRPADGVPQSADACSPGGFHLPREQNVRAAAFPPGWFGTLRAVLQPLSPELSRRRAADPPRPAPPSSPCSHLRPCPREYGDCMPFRATLSLLPIV
jgi:hypothetical protein